MPFSCVIFFLKELSMRPSFHTLSDSEHTGRQDTPFKLGNSRIQLPAQHQHKGYGAPQRADEPSLPNF